MMELKFDMVQTMAIAAALLFVGNYIKQRVCVIKRYYIPAPVVSGIIASLIILFGRQTGLFSVTFDVTLQSLFMNAFFTTVGFMASLKLLSQGGLGVVVMLIAATLLLTLQNVIGCSLASVFDLDPKFGLITGSVSLTGGHGTVGAFGKTIEDLGVVGAQTAGFAAATYGLIVGCLIGGPIGKLLLKRNKVKVHNDKAADEVINAEPTKDVVSTDTRPDPFSGTNLINATVCIAISMGLGSLVAPYVKAHTLWLMKDGLMLPSYLGPMLIAALIRNITDFAKRPIPMEAIDSLGSISLSIFLSMAMMTMKIWELIDLAIPLITILLVQTLLVILFVYFCTFRIMKIKAIGSPYDSTVICTGHCGFALGATPTAVANMTSFCEINGFSVKAFFIVPLIGSLFIDFINATVITTFINVLG